MPVLGWQTTENERKVSTLISSETALCGGDTIVAIAPAIRAANDETAAALVSVFILNSVALFIFPLIGHALNLTEYQFGVWSATAIHDTSAAVGAALKYGDAALPTAAIIKLAKLYGLYQLRCLFRFFIAAKVKKRRKLSFLILLCFFC